MKNLYHYAAIAGILACCPVVAAQDFNADQKLEAAVTDAANSSEAAKRSMEDQLLAQLTVSKSRREKSLLCRLLRRIGSARSIPALSSLLGDEETGHMARFALASIPGDQAVAAMREALPNVSETLQIGLMSSLSQRRDMKSLPLFEERLGTSLTLSAIQGLGLLGTKEAVEVLQRHRLSTEAIEYYREIDDALLAAAERLLKHGKSELPRQIYVGVYSAGGKLAALRGLATINDLHARKFVEEALDDDDVTVQRTALRAMMVMAGDDAVSVMREMLPSFSPTLQENVIDWLGELGDASARESVAAFLGSNQVELQAAAARALGGIGDHSIVSLLLEQFLHEDQSVRSAARDSVMRLPGEDVDAVLIAALEQKTSDSVSLVNMLAARGARSSLPVLREISRKGTGELRKASIKALGSLSSLEELPALVALLSDPAMKAETKSVESAILIALREISNPKDRAAPLLAAYKEAPDSVKPALVSLLGRAGSDEALTLTRKAVTSSQSAIRNAAVNTLARWPTKDAIEDLYQLAQTSEESSHRVIALRGYVNMAKGLKDAPTHYRKAIALATTPEDTKLILSGMGQTDSLETLKLCQEFLKEESVATEAALACIQISGRAWRKSTDEVEILMKSFAQHKDETVRQGAEKVLKRIVR